MDLRTGVTIGLVLALVAAPVRGVAAPAAQAVRPVLAFAPPARDPGHKARRRLAQDVAAALVRARRGRLAVPAPALDPRPLARARARFMAGALDEAASVLDLAVAAAARAPDAEGDATPVVDALVVRAAIALAQGDPARADELLGRLLRWDPGFALAAEEASPRLEEAAARVRAALGGRPGLIGTDLGGACARAPTLVVVRRLDATTLEVARWEDCRLATRVTVAPGAAAEGLARTLEPAPEPAPAVRPPQASGTRWWLWGTVGAAVVGAAAASYLVFADDGGDRVDVVPHP